MGEGWGRGVRSQRLPCPIAEEMREVSPGHSLTVSVTGHTHHQIGGLLTSSVCSCIHSLKHQNFLTSYHVSAPSYVQPGDRRSEADRSSRVRCSLVCVIPPHRRTRNCTFWSRRLPLKLSFQLGPSGIGQLA